MNQAVRSLALALIGLLVVSAPASASGPWKVGVLWDTSIIPPHLVPLADWLAADLKTHGFADADLQLVVRKVEPAGFREATQELLRERVDAIWASSTAAALAAKAETQTVPIVFGVGVAPEKLGLVQSIARPGGNATGIALNEGYWLTEKRLEIFKEMVPRLRRVLVTPEPGNRLSEAAVAEAREAARKLGVTLFEFPVGTMGELERLPEVLRRDSVDGYLHVLNGTINRHLDVAIKALNGARVPDMGYYLPGVAQGWTMAAYGSNHREAWRASARLLAKVLRGALPRDLPVESPDIVELHINLKVVKERHAELSRVILLRAHKLIE